MLKPAGADFEPKLFYKPYIVQSSQTKLVLGKAYTLLDVSVASNALQLIMQWHISGSAACDQET